MATTLYDLPPELLTQVLQAANNLKDLYSLIRASPLFWRVFVEFPSGVLTPVLENEIPPEVLREVLALFHVPQIPGLASVESFLNRLFGSEPFAFPAGLQAAIDLCQVHILVSRFVDDYFDAVSAAVFHQDPQGLPAKAVETGRCSRLSPLSTCERTRIYRAFLRYELYCRIFPYNRSRKLKPTFGPRAQFNLFLSRMPPWSVEEMTCVYHYLASLADEYIVDFEDEIVRSAVRIPGVRRPAVIPAAHYRPGDCDDDETPGTEIEEGTANPPPPGPRNWYSKGSPPHLQGADDDMLSFCFYSNRLRFFMCDRSDKTNGVGLFLSRGLGFMRELVDSEVEQRRLLVRKTLTRKPHRRCLTGALMYMHRQPPSMLPAEGAGDSPSQPSHAFYNFAQKPCNHYQEVHAFADTVGPLRDLGYVFWDLTRIVGCEPLRWSIETAREKIRYEVWRSVKDRLDGVTIPLREMCTFMAGLELGDYDS